MTPEDDAMAKGFDQKTGPAAFTDPVVNNVSPFPSEPSAESAAEIAALFDAAADKIGHESRGGVPIYDIKELKRIARRERLDIGVIAVPAPHAQPVVDQVVAAGIKGILNFSPGALHVPDDVKLKSVDFTVSLESLSFYLAQGDNGG